VSEGVLNGEGCGAVTEPAGWRPRRWVVPLFGLAAVVLVPWVVLLVTALPSAHRAAHWDIAWAGFDVALSLLLLTLAFAVRRRSPWLEGAATATATLLFVDAWFDVLTSSTRAELVVSIIEAAFVELPLAFLCLLLARDAERAVRVSPISRAAAHPRSPLVREQQVAEPFGGAGRGHARHSAERLRVR
jgi:hypothetical protein